MVQTCSRRGRSAQYSHDDDGKLDWLRVGDGRDELYVGSDDWELERFVLFHFLPESGQGIEIAG